jgi:hypothetical protein
MIIVCGKHKRWPVRLLARSAITAYQIIPVAAAELAGLLELVMFSG